MNHPLSVAGRPDVRLPAGFVASHIVHGDLSQFPAPHAHSRVQVERCPGPTGRCGR